MFFVDACAGPLGRSVGTFGPPLACYIARVVQCINSQGVSLSQTVKQFVLAAALVALSASSFGATLTVFEHSNGTSADPNEIAYLGPGVTAQSVVFATPYNGPAPYGDSRWISVPEDPGPEIMIADTFTISSLAGFGSGFLDMAVRNYGSVSLNGTLLGSTAGNAYPGFPAYTRRNFVFDLSLFKIGENKLEFTANANDLCGNCNLPLLDYNTGAMHQPIPEPGTYALMSAGIGAIVLFRRRFAKR